MNSLVIKLSQWDNESFLLFFQFLIFNFFTFYFVFILAVVYAIACIEIVKKPDDSILQMTDSV